MGFSATFSPVATGLFSPKLAKNGHFGQKWQKTGFLAIIAHFGLFLGFSAPPGPPRAGVLHQPLGGGPRGSPGSRRGPGGVPGRSPDRVPDPGGILQILWRSQGAALPRGRCPGDPGPGPRSRTPVPAGPARGVLHQPLAPGPRGTGGPGSRDLVPGVLPGGPQTALPAGRPRPPLFRPPGTAGVAHPLAVQARGVPHRGRGRNPPPSGGGGQSLWGRLAPKPVG